MKEIEITDIPLPPVMLGTWSWGTGFVGGNTIFGNSLGIEEVKPVYDKAIANGLFAFDTAPIYGAGASETLLGQCMQEKQVLISTKFMPFWLQPKNRMKKSLEESLERLHLQQVDIFWIHVPRNVKKWTRELIPLMKAHKIKYAGVSNHNLQEIIQAKKILEEAGLQLTAVQNHFSLLYLACHDNGILKWCHKNNILFFSYMVLEQGALTSKYNKEHPFPKNTRRAKAFSKKTLKKIEPLIHTLQSIADKYCVEVSDIAIAYAINKQTIPIIGVTKTHHIDSIIRAKKITLLPEEIVLLENVAKDTKVNIKGFWEKRM